MREFRSVFVLAAVLAGCVASAQYTFVDIHDNNQMASRAYAVHGGVVSGWYDEFGMGPQLTAWVGPTYSPSYLPSSGIAGAFGAHSGNVVAGVWYQGRERALIWDPAGGTTTDLHPSGYISSNAYASDGVSQVGHVTDNTVSNATMWFGTAVSAVDMHPVGYVYSRMYCVQGGYQGGSGRISNGNYVALLWNGNPIATLLHPLGYDTSEVRGIRGGVQVGEARTSNGWSQAMRWSSTAASAISIHPAGFDFSTCTGIGSDAIVGWGRMTSTGRYHALVWDVNTNIYTDLNQFLPVGYTNAYATAVDTLSGDVVGWADGPTGERAVVWKRASNNNAPSLNPIGNQTIPEDNEARIAMSGSDPDENDVITFSLGPGTPAGITIETSTPGNAELVWSPTEVQGPGEFEVTVILSDNNGGQDSETFTITVTEVNEPPAYHNVPEDVTITEGDLFKIDIDGSDIDIPAQTLTFSLVSGPAGLTVGTDGIICWQTDETHGGQTYPVMIELSDGVDTVQASMNIHVDEINTPPDVVNPGEQTVAEEETLTLQIQASDTDQPAQTLIYSLDEGGAGMNLDPDTGVLTWTPTEEDGPQTRSVQISVSDGVDATIINFDIVVGEVNLPPSIGTDGDLEVDVDQELTFTATASDPDVPANALTFSLDGAPDGATIDPSTGEFSWTPTEAGEFTFDVVVTDDGEPPLSASETITVTVNAPQNQPPVLAPIGAKTLDELTALDLDANATDPDSGQTLTYSLVNAPAGMTIDASSGVVSWTPTEAQGPQVYSVTVRVTDDGNPAESDMEIVVITVNEVNTPPSISVASSFVVNEHETLTINSATTDSDVPAQSLSYNLLSAPQGMSLAVFGGQASIQWTPTETQGGASYSVTLQAFDGVGGTDSKVIQVTVNEVNSAPVLDVIEDKTVREELLLMFTPVASDPDAGQTLTYSLSGDVPDGAYIQPDTGVFTYRPAAVQTPATHVVTVTVTDNGIPALSASRSFTINALRETRTINRVWVWGDPRFGNGAANVWMAPKRTTAFVGASRIMGGSTTILARYPDSSWRGMGILEKVLPPIPGDFHSVPVSVPLMQGFVDVGFGPAGTGILALTPSRVAYAWGLNDYGILGLGHQNQVLSPTAVAQLQHVLRPNNKSYSNHYLVATQGSLMSTEFLGNVSNVFRSASVESDFVSGGDDGGGYISGLRANGLAHDGFFGLSSINSVGPLARFASCYGIYAVDLQGNLFSLGEQYDGELGTGLEGYAFVTEPTRVLGITNVEDIAIGNYYVAGQSLTGWYTLALDSAGKLWYWGLGTTVPTAIPGPSNISGFTSGQIYGIAWSYGSVAAPIANIGPDQVVRVPHDGNPLTNLGHFSLNTSQCYDPDNEALSFQWYRGTTAIGTTPNQFFTYSPGIYNFSLTVTDETLLTASDSVKVTVLPELNAAPVAVKDSASTRKDTPINVRVLLNDSDPDGDAISITKAEVLGGGNVTIINGQLRFVPPPGFTGEKLITYTIKDPYGASSSSILSIKVVADSGIRR